MEGKIILIGLGNPIMSDDGMGLVVSREIHKRLPHIDLDLSCQGGFDVVDRIIGYETAAIIDSMATRQHPPGTVVRVDPQSSVKTLRSGDSHRLNFLEAIETARSYGAPIPANVILYGIEVEDPFSLGERISPVLLRRLGTIVNEIAGDLAGEEEENTCMS